MATYAVSASAGEFAVWGKTLPTQLYYASDDTVAVPSAVTTFAAACSSALAVSVGTGGHT